MLAELHSEFPLLDIVGYRRTLTGNGFWYVNQLVGEEVGHHLRNDLGIPFGIVNQLQSRATRLIRRAQKSKRKE